MSETGDQNTLLTFFRHHRWANQRVFDVCLHLTEEQLDHADPGAFGSIRATLTHIVRAEERYVSYLTDRAGPPSEERSSLAELKERARRSGEALLAVAADLQPGARVLATRGERREEVPVVALLLQAIYHAHEHRAQVATLMGQQGLQPPLVSGWNYYDDQKA